MEKDEIEEELDSTTGGSASLSSCMGESNNPISLGAQLRAEIKRIRHKWSKFSTELVCISYKMR